MGKIEEGMKVVLRGTVRAVSPDGKTCEIGLKSSQGNTEFLIKWITGDYVVLDHFPRPKLPAEKKVELLAKIDEAVNQLRIARETVVDHDIDPIGSDWISVTEHPIPRQSHYERVLVTVKGIVTTHHLPDAWMPIPEAKDEREKLDPLEEAFRLQASLIDYAYAYEHAPQPMIDYAESCVLQGISIGFALNKRWGWVVIHKSPTAPSIGMSQRKPSLTREALTL